MNNISPPRNTFGISHDDILHAHLEERTLTIADLQRGTLSEGQDRKKLFSLLLDYKTETALKERGKLKTLVSFQRRTNGFYAVARTLRYEKREEND